MVSLVQHTHTLSQCNYFWFTCNKYSAAFFSLPNNWIYVFLTKIKCPPGAWNEWRCLQGINANRSRSLCLTQATLFSQPDVSLARTMKSLGTCLVTIGVARSSVQAVFELMLFKLQWMALKMLINCHPVSVIQHLVLTLHQAMAETTNLGLVMFLLLSSVEQLQITLMLLYYSSVIDWVQTPGRFLWPSYRNNFSFITLVPMAKSFLNYNFRTTTREIRD